ncbi:MAG: hypothetical protein JXR25_00025 [Pontiellaceae bacterium]|nr:hypothetical protein [Pontiellaceae bacterium]MBN2783185.1 hypothetical protein [Pontiellaceae bacterium]
MAPKAILIKYSKSSAALTSVIIHVGLAAVAFSVVAVRVYVKPEQRFEYQSVPRPRMNLRRLQVPVKLNRQQSAPRLRKTLVTKPRTVSHQIRMPEIVGVSGGLGGSAGGQGLARLGFSLDQDLFGRAAAGGNELEGTFFDLKQKPDGSPARMDEEIYREVLKDFCNSWNIKRLERNYFQAPRKKYAAAFVLPKMNAEEAPRAFSVQGQVQPMQWVAYYKGAISAPQSGRFRFWGIADDVLMVRVKKQLVIDANRPSMDITGWTNNDENDRKYTIEGQPIRVGDWFYLKQGSVTEMEVMIGERPGGDFSCHLFIEQEGVDYPEGKDGRPILPLFKTEGIPSGLLAQMKIDPQICSSEGPEFGIYK